MIPFINIKVFQQSDRHLDLKEASCSSSQLQNLRQIRLLPLGKCPPTIGTYMQHDFLPDDSSLVQQYAFILAQQTQLTINRLKQRLSNSSDGDPSDHPEPNTKPPIPQDIDTVPQSSNTLQLKNEFATNVLRWTHDALERISDDLLILKVVLAGVH